MTPSKSDRIAICGEYFPSSSKQRLLFFDRIGIIQLHESLISLRNVAKNVSLGEAANNIANNIANDLEFLASKNIAFEPPKVRWLSEEVSGLPKLNANRSIVATWEDLNDVSSILTALSKLSFRGRELGREEVERIFEARLIARSMQHSDGVEASVVRSEPLAIPPEVQYLLEAQMPSTNGIAIVLDKLPMPSELTPWEAILDFKADTEAQGYLQGLKVWMSDLARQKLTPNEASEKLDWLLFQHKKHMDMHKLSYRWGTLGGTFVAAAEILEDLAKIKWGKAAGAIVSIFDKRLELMKSELDNPAKEVSYIVKAQEQFGE
jgi:hypothetical protein